MARVTLKDIAAQVGVSVSTVSLALRGSERISQPVRDHVLEVAEELGYRPDLAGSLLRTSVPRLIGLVCDVGQDLHVEYSREIIRQAQARGWLVMTQDVAVDGAQAAISRLTQLRAASMIVVDPCAIGPQVLSQVEVPLVCIGQEGVLPEADLIRSNNDSGMRELAVMLKDAERLIYLDGGSSASSRVRRASFLSAMREVAARRLEPGGAEAEVISAGSTIEAGWTAVQWLLEHEDPQGLVGTVLVCYNDHCALGAVSGLWRSGLSVPEDVRVVGFDNSRTARSPACQLTSIDRQTPVVAGLAVERAIHRAQGGSDLAVCVEIDTRLVRRRSA